MVRPPLILIGYWATEPADGWPSPASFVDTSWDTGEREVVTEYLRRGFVSRAYMGYSPCRLCGRDNGCLELSDGIYVWPDGLAHYVSEHAVRLPPVFVEHVLSMIDMLETSSRDQSWWRQIGH